MYIRQFGAILGEELQCHQETDNIHDLHVVATGIVGHMKRVYLTPCNIFIRSGGIIICIITGNQRYSTDHPRGGLDVPCQLVFKGSKEMLN